MNKIHRRYVNLWPISNVWEYMVECIFLMCDSIKMLIWLEIKKWCVSPSGSATWHMRHFCFFYGCRFILWWEYNNTYYMIWNTPKVGRPELSSPSVNKKKMTRVVAFLFWYCNNKMPSTIAPARASGIIQVAFLFWCRNNNTHTKQESRGFSAHRTTRGMACCEGSEGAALSWWLPFQRASRGAPIAERPSAARVRSSAVSGT
jgi:hypothetical protein